MCLVVNQELLVLVVVFLLVSEPCLVGMRTIVISFVIIFHCDASSEWYHANYIRHFAYECILEWHFLIVPKYEEDHVNQHEI